MKRHQSRAGPDRNDQSDTEEPAPEPPSPEQVKKLLAGLSEVTIKLDREQKNSYDLMVLRTAQESLERAGLKVIAESQDAPSALLTLSFDAEKANPFIVFYMGAELKCRDEDSREVSLWKLRKEVAKLSPNVLGNTPPSVSAQQGVRLLHPLYQRVQEGPRGQRATLNACRSPP